MPLLTISSSLTLSPAEITYVTSAVYTLLYTDASVACWCTGRGIRLAVDRLRFWSRVASLLALHPSGVAKSSISVGWGKGGNVTCAGWQVALCDPIGYKSSRSGEAKLLLTALCLPLYLPLPLLCICHHWLFSALPFIVSWFSKNHSEVVGLKVI